MKKTIITLLFIISIFFVACTNVDTANVSSVTNYPIITVLGADHIFVPQGTPYTDPGVSAVAGTATVPVTVTSAGAYRGGTLDTNIADQYNITYSAKNSDGFTGSAIRTVNVYKTGDLVSSIEGLYTSTVVRNGVSGAQYTDMKYILIWKNSNGTYEMSDGIGGYYSYGRGYGIGYNARPVIITANNIPANNFTVPNFSVGVFGGVAKMTALNANPVSKTITFTTTWDSGYTFVVTLKQVQP